MIDFRYHLVSIVAVFLALAIGLVLGSTELRGTALDALQTTSDSLRSDLSAANSARDAYSAQVGADQQVISAAEPVTLKSLLTGDKIVLITEPGASSDVISGIQKAAGYAGATITGTIALQTKFNDTSGGTEATLNNLDGQIAQNDTTTLGTPSDSQTANQQQAAQLLAGAVVTRSATTASGLTLTEAQTLLTDFGQAGFISVSGQPQAGATLAVIVTPDSVPSDGSSDSANQVLVAVAQEFASASAATIVTGNTSGDGSGSAMSVLRAASVSGQVSTIDNADTASGQVAAIWALNKQVNGQKAGAYGVQAGASSGGPSPAPTPSASVTGSGNGSHTGTRKAKGKK
jgi:hypothetical protein